MLPCDNSLVVKPTRLNDSSLNCSSINSQQRVENSVCAIYHEQEEIRETQSNSCFFQNVAIYNKDARSFKLSANELQGDHSNIFSKILEPMHSTDVRSFEMRSMEERANATKFSGLLKQRLFYDYQMTMK